MTGIYKITNILNNKVYIGSSVNIKYRFYEHLLDLRSNSHINKHLQSAWNKYGEENFKFEIIRLVSKNILRKAEQFYINKHKALIPKFGYNKTVVVANYNDCKEEKISIKDTNYFGCYSKVGKLIKVFRTIAEVYNYLGGRYTRVYESINSDLTKTANGLYWIRYDVSKGKFPLKLNVKSRKGRHRKIVQCSIDNKVIKEWDSAVEAAKELKLSSFNITRCLKKDNLYKNYKWFYSAP